MSVVISTVKFKEMLNRVVKCAGNDGSKVITQFVGIKADDMGLRLYTTDDKNYFRVSTDYVTVDGNIDISVRLEQMIALTNKLTTEKIELSVSDGVLSIRANGKYKIGVELDGQGNILKFPDISESVDTTSNGFKEVNSIEVADVVSSAKQALATNYTYPILTNYYAGKCIIASDGEIVAKLNYDLFGGEYVIEPKLMGLIALMGDNLKLYDLGYALYFESNDCRLYHRYNQDAEQYPSKEFIACCEDFNVAQSDINKYSMKFRVKEILDALDRVMLFSNTTSTPIQLEFSNDGLKLSSEDSAGVEEVSKHEGSFGETFKCRIDGTLFENQLRAYPEVIVDIRFGADTNIKFISENYTFVISLLNQK